MVHLLSSFRSLMLAVVTLSAALGPLQQCDPPKPATVTIDAPDRRGPPEGYLVTVSDVGGNIVAPRQLYPEVSEPAPRYELTPGCYVFTLETRPTTNPRQFIRWYESGAAVWDLDICVTAGEQRTVRARRYTFDTSCCPPSARGAVRYQDGTPAASVKIDTFTASASLSDAEVASLTIADHRARDYREVFIGPHSSDGDGYYRIFWPGFGSTRCLVATAVAPDGAVWVATDSRFLQRSLCPDEDVPSATFVLRRTG